MTAVRKSKIEEIEKSIRSNQTNFSRMSKISPVLVYRAPKEMQERAEAFFSKTHPEFMEKTHFKTGEKKLRNYVNGKAPLLSNPLDLSSAPVEDGTVCYAFVEFYEAIEGLQDHWEQAQGKPELSNIGEFMEILQAGSFDMFQPVQIMHEINRLKPGEDVKGCCHVLFFLTVPAELKDDLDKMVELHHNFMETTHCGGEFTGDKEMLHYAVGTCPILKDPMNLASEPDGRHVMMVSETYRTKAGLELHWQKAPGTDAHNLMLSLFERGAAPLCCQPMSISASLNWI